jgi:hypothetical protein
VSRHAENDPAATLRLVEQILAAAPDSEADFEQQLDRFEPRAARAALVELLRSRELGCAQLDLLCVAFGYLGLGECREALSRIVLDPRCGIETRQAAQRALAAADPDLGIALATQLSPDELQSFAEQSIVDSLQLAHGDPEHGDLLVQVLRGTAPRALADSLDLLERARGRAQVPAVVYRSVLRDRSLAPAHEALLRVLADEGGLDAVLLLAELRKRPPKSLHAALQAAWLRARNRSPSGPAYDAELLVSAVDGAGQYLLIGEFPQGRGACMVAQLQLDVAGTVHSAGLGSRQKPGAMRELLATSPIGGGLARFGPIPVADARQLVAQCTTQAVGGQQAVTPEIMHAAGLFDRARAPARSPYLRDLLFPARTPRAASAAPAGSEEIDALLDLPELGGSWLFEIDRVARGTERAIAARFETSHGERVVRMARFMERWFQWRGDARTAARFAAAAAATEASFVASPLVLGIVRRSLRVLDEYERGQGE